MSKTIPFAKHIPHKRQQVLGPLGVGVGGGVWKRSHPAHDKAVSEGAINKVQSTAGTREGGQHADEEGLEGENKHECRKWV